MAMEALTMAKQQEKTEDAAVNRITLHTTRYISVYMYIRWSTFDAVDFWCLLLLLLLLLFATTPHKVYNEKKFRKLGSGSSFEHRFG